MDTLVVAERLANGAYLKADLSGHPRHSPLRLAIVADKAILSDVALPYPKAGVAGGRLIIAPSHQLAILSLYSGQSQEGFELFSLTPRLSHIGGVEYQPGEMADFAFNESETEVAMALPGLCSEWWQPWVDGDAQPTDRQSMVFEFGTILRFSISDQALRRYHVVVEASPRWEPREREYDPLMHPRFGADGSLTFRMPWGETSVASDSLAMIRVRIPEDRV